VVQSVLVASLVGSAAIVHYRNRLGEALQHAAIWIFLMVLAVFLYSYKDAFIDAKNRITGELSPSFAQSGDGVLTFKRARNGHFHIKAEVNTHPVRFMLDTGATDIVLDKDTARRIGISVDTLRYNKVYNTANGQVMGASIRLPSLTIGGYRWVDVPASVNGGELKHPLLGMRFLERLKSYQIEGETLTFVP